MSQGRPNIERLKRKRVVAELVRALRHDDVGVQLDAAKALNELDKERPLSWEPADAHEHLLLIVSRSGPVDEEELARYASEAVDTLAASVEHYRGSDVLTRALVAVDPDRAVGLLVRLLDDDAFGGDHVIAAFDAVGDPRTVGPLLNMVRKGWGEKALMALEHVIEKSGSAVPVEVLKSVVSLENEETYRWGFSSDLRKGTKIMTTKAVALAQEELVRRHSPSEAEAMKKAREGRWLSATSVSPKRGKLP